ncbi:hypothetical protein FRC09_002012 [Ceratobasidium sp. 395]|nr:hypothetical protein FRC09_002012 [Ceratobasidium sp. 395]
MTVSCLVVTDPSGVQVQTPTPESQLVRGFTNQGKLHKQIWRHEERADEGTTLNQFEGVFGVYQVAGFRDNTFNTRINYLERLRDNSAAPYFTPTRSSRTDETSSTVTRTAFTLALTLESTNEPDKVAGSANDKIEAPQLGPPSGPALELVDVDTPNSPNPPFSLQRDTSFASDLLMLKGRPLSEAQSALHDWKRPVKESLGKLVWDSLSSESLPDREVDATDAPNGLDRKGYAFSLERGLYAVLCDVEHAASEGRLSEVIYEGLMGTPAFVSGHLLANPSDDELPVRRTFIHDFESLMWVLIWVVAHEKPKQMSDEARDFIRSLTQRNLNTLGDFKRRFVMGRMLVAEKISAFGNTRSRKLAHTIQHMAHFFACLLYPFKPLEEEIRRNPTVPRDPKYVLFDFSAPADAHIQQLLLDRHYEYTKFDRWTTFMYFLNMFQWSIDQLSSVEDSANLEKL